MYQMSLSVSIVASVDFDRNNCTILQNAAACDVPVGTQVPLKLFVEVKGRNDTGVMELTTMEGGYFCLACQLEIVYINQRVYRTRGKFSY